MPELRKAGEAMSDHYDEKKPWYEAKGDCTICKGWVDDGRGGCCVYAVGYWTPSCPFEKEVER